MTYWDGYLFLSWAVHGTFRIFCISYEVLLFPISLDGILDHGVSLDLARLGRGFYTERVYIGWGCRCFSDKLVTCLALVTPTVRSELIQRSRNRDSFIG